MFAIANKISLSVILKFRSCARSIMPVSTLLSIDNQGLDKMNLSTVMVSSVLSRCSIYFVAFCSMNSAFMLFDVLNKFNIYFVVFCSQYIQYIFCFIFSICYL